MVKLLVTPLVAAAMWTALAVAGGDGEHAARQFGCGSRGRSDDCLDNNRHHAMERSLATAQDTKFSALERYLVTEPSLSTSSKPTAQPVTSVATTQKPTAPPVSTPVVPSTTTGAATTKPTAPPVSVSSPQPTAPPVSVSSPQPTAPPVSVSSPQPTAPPVSTPVVPSTTTGAATTKPTAPPVSVSSPQPTAPPVSVSSPQPTDSRVIVRVPSLAPVSTPCATVYSPSGAFISSTPSSSDFPTRSTQPDNSWNGDVVPLPKSKVPIIGDLATHVPKPSVSSAGGVSSKAPVPTAPSVSDVAPSRRPEPKTLITSRPSTLKPKSSGRPTAHHSTAPPSTPPTRRPILAPPRPLQRPPRRPSFAPPSPSASSTTLLTVPPQPLPLSLAPIPTPVPLPFAPTTPGPKPQPLTSSPITPGGLLCSMPAQPGDLAVGIDTVTDPTCLSGGLGCVGSSSCRLCKRFDTPSSQHLIACDSVTGDSLASASLLIPVAPSSPSPGNTVTSTGPCATELSPGDKAVGIEITSDASCLNGGLGCVGATCRLCRAWDTPQSNHLAPCSTIVTWDSTPTIQSAQAPASPSVTSSSSGSCAAISSPGDRAVGIHVVADATCVNGGLGCVGSSCRLCKMWETPQSAHLDPCSTSSAQSDTAEAPQALVLSAKSLTDTKGITSLTETGLLCAAAAVVIAIAFAMYVMKRKARHSHEDILPRTRTQDLLSPDGLAVTPPCI